MKISVEIPSEHDINKPVWIVMRDFTIRAGVISCIQYTAFHMDHDLRFGVTVKDDKSSAIIFRQEGELYSNEAEARTGAAILHEQAKQLKL
jgi:hypothetical protein